MISPLHHRHTQVASAAPDDAPAIRDFMRHVIVTSVTTEPELLRDTLANVNANVDVWLAAPERCVHLKALQDDALVGVVLVKDFWNLCSLFVAPHLHRQGVGRTLVEAAAAQCRGRSPKAALYLNAATDAVPFYTRLGFVPRPSTQPLPPGFQAMLRPLDAPPGG